MCQLSDFVNGGPLEDYISHLSGVWGHDLTSAVKRVPGYPRNNQLRSSKAYTSNHISSGDLKWSIPLVTTRWCPVLYRGYMMIYPYYSWGEHQHIAMDILGKSQLTYPFNSIYLDDLLVGGFKHLLIFHNLWDNPPHWLIFFEMVKSTNQFVSISSMCKPSNVSLGDHIIWCPYRSGLCWGTLWQWWGDVGIIRMLAGWAPLSVKQKPNDICGI